MNKPYFSIVIPARNEEAYLASCLKAIEQSAQKTELSYEVIVVVNRCTDKTEEIARNAGCKIVKTEVKNLSIIRNLGAAEAIGEIIITIDADSRMSKGMLTHIAKTIESNKYIGGGVMMYTDRMSLGIFLTGFVLFALFAVFDPIFGGLFFCKREDFEAINGFDESLVSVEDIDFAKRHKKTW